MTLEEAIKEIQKVVDECPWPGTVEEHQQLLAWLEDYQKMLSKPERKTGEWIGDCCSCCGVSKYNYIKMVDDECGPFGTWNFCPNCGSEMTRGE